MSENEITNPLPSSEAEEHTENTILETWDTQAHTDESAQETNPVMITANTDLSGIRLRNFYITNGFQGFVWMIFHFSVVFFFTFQLKSVALVGIFLGIANAIAFFIDIPVGILQKYYSTKKLFILSGISQLIAVGIFFNFIYGIFGAAGDIIPTLWSKALEQSTSWFFWNALNWILILIASFCYGLSKEINDISTFGYILSNSNPSEYQKILARNNITYGIWSLLGLLLSWVILSVNPTFAVISLGWIIAVFLYFTSRFFDNAHDTIETSDIVSFTVAVKKLNKENVQEYLTEKISAIDLAKIIDTTKYVFLKPKQKTENPFNMKEFLSETKKTAEIIWKIMSHMPIYLVIYWTMTLVLIFGFWDTFASTFLINFLDDIKPGMSYVLLAFIAIPALGLQEVAGKISQKLGVKTVAFIGLGLSGGSLIAMGVWTIAGFGVLFTLSCALINSVGYACGMSLGQNGFLESYNKVYAEHMHLKEIDSNASAGPMKILQNFANVIGLVFGWIILWILGYAGFFVIFGVGILWALAWSIHKNHEIHI
jgi:Major Facilitator Superfamily